MLVGKGSARRRTSVRPAADVLSGAPTRCFRSCGSPSSGVPVCSCASLPCRRSPSVAASRGPRCRTPRESSPVASTPGTEPGTSGSSTRAPSACGARPHHLEPAGAAGHTGRSRCTGGGRSGWSRAGPQGEDGDAGPAGVAGPAGLGRTRWSARGSRFGRTGGPSRTDGRDRPPGPARRRGASFDDLDGTTCRVGETQQGVLDVSYGDGGVATLTCVATALQPLTVTLDGAPYGTVSSTTAGITCGTDCTEVLRVGHPPRRGGAADRCLNQTCTRRDSNP